MKIQVTLVSWSAILCQPCGEVTTVMHALVCPGEAFTFHHCELFEVIIAYNRSEVWSCDVNCHYGNRNCSFTNTWTTVSLKSVIMQSYHLKSTFLCLGWHWKGAKKWKKLETVVLTSSGRGHEYCDFMYKQNYVWYTEMLTQQTIKWVLFCHFEQWWSLNCD